MGKKVSIPEEAPMTLLQQEIHNYIKDHLRVMVAEENSRLTITLKLKDETIAYAVETLSGDPYDPFY